MVVGFPNPLAPGIQMHVSWGSRLGDGTMVKDAEVEFVHPVSPSGSVKFVASGVNFSIFTIFLCFFLLKLLKLGEIGGVKFLT